MTEQPRLRRSEIVRRMSLGSARTWLFFGLCESAIVTVWPGFVSLIRGVQFSQDWLATPLWLISYALTGLVVGAAAGLLVVLVGRWRSLSEPDLDRVALSMATASTIVAFWMNLEYAARAGRLSQIDGFAIGAVGLASAALIFSSLRWPKSLPGRDIAHPWSAVVILFGVVWLTHDFPVPRFDLHSALELFLVGILAVGTLACSWRLHRVSWPWRVTPLVLGVGAVLLCSAIVGHRGAPAQGTLTKAGAMGGVAPVVLVVLDTVRADHLSLYGYHRDTDANLRRLARQSTLYTDAIMPGDMTLPSHASIFTGLHVSRHDARNGKGTLRDEALTMAELLRQHEYSTAAVVANCGWLGTDHGIDQGFQYYDARCGTTLLAGMPPHYPRETPRALLREVFFPERASWRWRGANEIVRQSVSLLEGLAVVDHPFFLFLNFMDAHRPIHPPRPYNELFPGKVDGFDMEADYSAFLEATVTGELVVSEAERAHLISQYDGAIAYVDSQLGELFERMRDLELFDRSLIVITSDHGESFAEGFGQRPTFGHGRSVYQDAVAVPMIIKYPHQAVGEVRNERVSGVDLLPTVLDVLDIPPLARLDGQSLVRPTEGARTLYSESFLRDGALSRAIFSGASKLVAHRHGDPELYDLVQDPHEESDLSLGDVGTVAELSKELTAWVDGVSGAVDPQPAGMTPEQERRLRGLGYIR